MEKKIFTTLPFFFGSLRVTCHKEAASPRKVRRVLADQRCGWRGLTHRCGSGWGRTRAAASACTARATRSARSPQRSQPCGAQCSQLDRTACDRRGPRRVGRAVRGGTGLWCWAIACGGGPPPRARTSCTGCTCAMGCGVTHGTLPRACWYRRTAGATLHRPWSLYSTKTVPLGRPRPLGRHDERQRPEHRGASACCWYV